MARPPLAPVLTTGAQMLLAEFLTDAGVALAILAAAVLLAAREFRANNRRPQP